MKFESKFFWHICTNLLRFLHCKDHGYAKVVFKCSDCGLKAFRPVTCKSRFCTCCGTEYAINWATKTSEALINKNHRSCVFSIPFELRNYFKLERKPLSEISDAIFEILDHHFKKNKIVSWGCIINIHTFGRDCSFHPHFHVLFSLGGFDKKGTFKKLDFFPAEAIKNSFRHKVIQICKKYFNINHIISDLYKRVFYVNMKGKSVKSDVESIKYFGRYLARPAIAEYRIIAFDGANVTYWFNDLETKSKGQLTLPLFIFMGRLILHIPPKNFKMVRRYGFYARRKKAVTTSLLAKFKNNRLFPKAKLPWEERIKKAFGTNPLICPNCNIKMKLVEFHHQIYGSYLYNCLLTQ